MPNDLRSKLRDALPIVDCQGCGVCCFHMGYPPFIRPVAALEAEQIEADDGLIAEIASDENRPMEREAGQAGEKWWYLLPDDLRTELDQYIAGYEHKVYTGVMSSLDGPCVWFNLETRQCKHHEYRPNVCRDFEIGSKQCREWRKYYRDRIGPRL